METSEEKGCRCKSPCVNGSATECWDSMWSRSFPSQLLGEYFQYERALKANERHNKTKKKQAEVR